MLLFLFAVLITAAILEKISLTFPIAQVSYKLKPSSTCVEPGEKFCLVTTIGNTSGRNVSHLYLKEMIPAEIELMDADQLELEQQKNGFAHCSTMFIRKNERVRRSISVKAYKRGIHYLKGAEMYFGDFLGICGRERCITQSYGVLVYPIRLEDERLKKIVSDILGEISVTSFLFQDPMLVKSYRDYTGREPFKSISFLQSAQKNKLMVKEFDYTREELLDIIFDLGYKGDFDHYFNQREATFSIVRTVCESLEYQGCPYRLITNMSSESDGNIGILRGGEGNSNFQKLLEILGMASGAALCKTEELLETAIQGCFEKGAFVYVAHREEKEAARRLEEIRQQYGVRIYCLYGEDYEEAFLNRQKHMKMIGKEGA